jgi:ketosteroid isomerase-like protein
MPVSPGTRTGKRSRDTAQTMHLGGVEVPRGVRSAVLALTDRSRRGRTLDQRVYVRFPALYRVLARGIMRLSPQSRIRRLMVARSMALAYAAFNRRDFAVVLVGHDPEIEYRPSRDLTPPDFDAVFHGREGFLRLWRYWLDAFDDIRWEPEELLDLGEMFLVATQQRGRGSGSGVDVSEPVFQLYTLREGLVIRQEDFLALSEALDAARPSND